MSRNTFRRLLPADPAVRYALIIFTCSRLFVSLWAILVLAISPQPEKSDEFLRPYLGETELKEGPSGLLLGPWQRFDTLRYLRIARQGYDEDEDSVFPPLYPLAIRIAGVPFRALLPPSSANILAAILLSNGAYFTLLMLLYRITTTELNEGAARRSLVYLTIFPTGFFLLAAYTETLFILFSLAAIWAGREGRFWPAGIFGLLASLTRSTGWVLIIPLAFEYIWQHRRQARRLDLSAILVFLPVAGFVGFLAWRRWAGLPSMAEIYRNYWYQTVSFPGVDLFTAGRQILTGQAAFTLWFDFSVAILLIVTLVITFRRLKPVYGLYSLMLLFFILLPTSEVKPLFSYSRYALAFFPMFMLFGSAGRNPWINRLIVYPSIALYLYFSGQFFLWGWVA